MVGADGEAVFVEETRQRFRAKLQGGVDDGGLGGRVCESFKKVIPTVGICERGDRKVKVGSVKGELMVVVRGDVEVVTNVPGNPRCRCCCEAENPLNPETLIQRTRDLQTGFEEQIKSASGGMLDLGTKKIMFFLSLPKRRNPTFAICRRFT